MRLRTAAGSPTRSGAPAGADRCWSSVVYPVRAWATRSTTPNSRPGEQCRHPVDAYPHRGHHRGSAARCFRRQRVRPVAAHRHPRASDGAQRWGCDRQHRVHHRTARCQRVGGLLREQGRHTLADEIVGRRIRPRRGTGERHGAWTHSHRTTTGIRRTPRAGPGTSALAPHEHTRGKSPPVWSFSPATPPAMSMVPSSASTAAGRRFEECHAREGSQSDRFRARGGCCPLSRCHSVSSGLSGGVEQRICQPPGGLGHVIDWWRGQVDLPQHGFHQFDVPQVAESAGSSGLTITLITTVTLMLTVSINFWTLLVSGRK